jgi:hypothetical protein
MEKRMKGVVKKQDLLQECFLDEGCRITELPGLSGADC